MDFLDYREKLGFKSSEQHRFGFFCTKIFNVLNGLRGTDFMAQLGSDEYFGFCNLTASPMDQNIWDKPYCSNERFCHCVQILNQHTGELDEFLLYYIAFINSVEYDNKYKCNRIFLAGVLEHMLKDSHINYVVMETDKEFFAFPKGAKELDDALVSEPLAWLEKFPTSHNTFCRALKQYSNGEHTRDVADNFRKALEEFLQEYLGNKKNLESNKTEVCKYLGLIGVDAEFGGLIHPLLNTYKNINDTYAKHHDLLDEKLLEFIMYQTGVFIRMLISVKV